MTARDHKESLVDEDDNIVKNTNVLCQNKITFITIFIKS